MSGRRLARPERLHRAPFALPRPRGLLRLLVAGTLLAAAAVLVAPPPPSDAPRHGAAETPVLTAARDLPAGAPLRPADLRLVRFPATLAPRGVLRSVAEAAGRSPTTPVRAGEPLTDVRLLGRPLLTAVTAATGAVAAAVRLADAGVAALVRPGDTVDVLAAKAPGVAGVDPPGAPTAAAEVIATAVPVLAVPGGAGGGAAPGAQPAPGAAGEGGLVVLAVSPAVATRLAAAAAGSRLSLVVRSR